MHSNDEKSVQIVSGKTSRIVLKLILKKKHIMMRTAFTGLRIGIRRRLLVNTVMSLGIS
jgi:hypothetical protein